MKKFENNSSEGKVQENYIHKKNHCKYFNSNQRAALKKNIKLQFKNLNTYILISSLNSIINNDSKTNSLLLPVAKFNARNLKQNLFTKVCSPKKNLNLHKISHLSMNFISVQHFIAMYLCVCLCKKNYV